MPEPEPKPPEHILVPKHEILGREAVEKLLSDCHVTLDKFPKICIADPALSGLPAKIGDVIKITREDETAENVYYRAVVQPHAHSASKSPRAKKPEAPEPVVSR